MSIDWKLVRQIYDEFDYATKYYEDPVEGRHSREQLCYRVPFLLQTIDELRDALRPFAEIGKGLPEWCGDDESVARVGIINSPASDFRRARDVVGSSE